MSRLRRLVALLMAAVTGLYAPAGVVAFALQRLVDRKLAAPRAWGALGLGYLGLVLVGPVLRGDPGSIVRLAAGAAFMVLAGVLVSAARRHVALGMLVSLVTIALAVGAVRLSGRHMWVDPSRGPTVVEILRRAVLPTTLGPGGAPRYRSWRVGGASGELTLHLELRKDAGDAGWDWNSSTQAAHLHPVRSDQGSWTRFTPTGANPFIFRGFDLGRPIAGRSFRASVQLRSEGAPMCGHLYLAERGAAHRTGAAVCAGDRWSTQVLTWAAPPSARRHEIDVILNGFHGGTLDIRDPAIEIRQGSRWAALTPLTPTGVAITVSWGRGAPWTPAQDHTRTLQVMPATAWTGYAVSVPRSVLGQASQVWARLQPERGLQVSVRRTSLTDRAADGARPVAVTLRRPGRQRLWFGQFNLAGHAILVDGLVLLSAAGSWAIGLAGAALALLGIAATGSRAAFGAALIGFPWLMWFLFTPRQRPRFLAALAGGAAVLGLAMRHHLLGRLQAWTVAGPSDPVSRWQIWVVASRALRGAPWTGIGEGDAFAGFWQRHQPSGVHTSVTHAHNLYLQYGASDGLFGLAAVLFFTVGLLALGWRWGRWRGFALVVPVIFLQLFDVTLFYAGVLVPLVLGLNALARRRRDPPTAAPQASSPSGVSGPPELEGP